MNFEFRILGTITYRKNDYKIKSMKTHSGPRFDFEYYENVNESMEDLLSQISHKLIDIVDQELQINGPIQKEYIGEIEIKRTDSELVAN